MTADEYNSMCRATGFDRKKVKRHKYVAYRNYSCVVLNSPAYFTWIKLYEQGYAEISDWLETTCYFTVTEKGIEYIERQENCKIQVEA